MQSSLSSLYPPWTGGWSRPSRSWAWRRLSAIWSGITRSIRSKGSSIPQRKMIWSPWTEACWSCIKTKWSAVRPHWPTPQIRICWGKNCKKSYQKRPSKCTDGLFLPKIWVFTLLHAFTRFYTLFHGHTLRQIPRLIHIQSFRQGDIIGHQL